jgi:hypothetical protein
MNNLTTDAKDRMFDKGATEDIELGSMFSGKRDAANVHASFENG